MATVSRRNVLQAGAVLFSGLGVHASTVEERDRSDQHENALKVLVVGGHPDDPESGCGGTIALFADAGHDVVVCYLTRGEAGIPGKTHDEAARIRTAEAEAACAILGARPVFAGQIDGATEVTGARYEGFIQLVEAETPDIVFAHWPIDTHRDHRVASLLAYDAWLRLKRRFTLYYFEVLTGRQSQLFHPTHYVDIATTLSRKKEACLKHGSQHAAEDFYPHHEEMQDFRGTEAGVKAAEAFVRLTPGATPDRMV